MVQQETVLHCIIHDEYVVCATAVQEALSYALLVNLTVDVLWILVM